MRVIIQNSLQTFTNNNENCNQNELNVLGTDGSKLPHLLNLQQKLHGRTNMSMQWNLQFSQAGRLLRCATDCAKSFFLAQTLLGLILSEGQKADGFPDCGGGVSTSFLQWPKKSIGNKLCSTVIKDIVSSSKFRVTYILTFGVCHCCNVYIYIYIYKLLLSLCWVESLLWWTAPLGSIPALWLDLLAVVAEDANMAHRIQLDEDGSAYNIMGKAVLFSISLKTQRCTTE